MVSKGLSTNFAPNIKRKKKLLFSLKLSETLWCFDDFMGNRT